MEIVIKTAQFLLSLSILVILHEFGHFAFAKLFKTRVEKFYLFFDPWFSIFKFKKGETEYGLGWLPLGGYVKISGMIDESFDKEQLKQPPQPWEFRSKPTGQRLLIMIGGVLVNFLLALVIYSISLYIWGEEYLPAENAIYGITVDSLAYKAGLRNGDKILSVDNVKVEDFLKIPYTIAVNQAKTVQVIRNNEKIDVALPEDLTHALIRLKKNEFISVRYPFVIGEFMKESVAKKAGFLIGDKIVSINGEEALYFDEVRAIISKNVNQKISVAIERAGQIYNIDVVVPASGKIGIAANGDLSKFFKLKHLQYNFFESIPAGISKGFEKLADYVRSFKLIFSRSAKGYESLGGFITMGSIFSGVWDWQSFWSLTAFLSIILAFMNILPIPVLDGGHVLFLLYEMITGRKPSDKFLEHAQIVGLVILIGLMLYANGNDIVRHFFK